MVRMHLYLQSDAQSQPVSRIASVNSGGNSPGPSIEPSLAHAGMHPPAVKGAPLCVTCAHPSMLQVSKHDKNSLE